MSSVRWLLPNGTVLTHGSNHPRILVLNDGSLNFSNVLPSDTGVYTCMVTNVAGNSNASAYLNVSAAELNTSDVVCCTTTEIIDVVPTVSEDAVKPKTTVTASPSVFQPVFISTPTVLLQTPRQVSMPTSPRGTPRPPSPSLDDMMKTTKIIISCFVAVTMLAAAMLVVFYKLRKRHQHRSSVAAARTIEIIHMQEQEQEVPPPASSGTCLPGEGLRDHNSIYKPYSSSTYKAAHGAMWTENNISNSLHRSRPTTTTTAISTIHEPYLKKSHKEKVQETQI